MDVTTHANEMISTSVQAQQRLWDSWLKLAEGLQPRFPAAALEQLTHQQFKVWEDQTNGLVDQMQGILNAQSVWVRRLNNTPLMRLPKLYDSWLQQVQQAAEMGTRVNREIIEGCVEAGKHLNPIKVVDIWNGTLERSVEISGEVFQKVMEAELALLPGGLGEPEKKPERKKAAG
jgi:hypothetical protein